MKKNNYVRNSSIVIAALIIILIVVVAMKSNASKSPVTVSQTTPVFASGKIVNVGVTGSQYTFSPSQVKTGEKVSLVFDMNQLKGCSRSVVIQEYGIRKLVSETNNIIEFTPQKIGKVQMACSMNMYRGSLEVIE